ncbi:MAG: hypothetical protein E7426_04410 [Ruminococcaceae bacterium]|jgi:hypothetical protein|nr:hypothetical protein [Oscillospiraceae bacterium]
MDYERERQEAVEAGERALQSLYAARDSLQSARNWGVWDIIGGGLISTMVKRGHMNDARDAMAQAEQDLTRFQQELADVGEYLQLETDDFLAFADYFFDGIFVDLVVQSRIKEAQAQVDTVIDRVEGLLDWLKKE